MITDPKELERYARREMQRWPHVRASATCPHCFQPKDVTLVICGSCRAGHVVAEGKYDQQVLRSIRVAERELEEGDVFNQVSGDLFDAEWDAMERSLGIKW